MSPLIATLLLVVFALIIGTATMNWGKSYVENIELEKSEKISGVLSDDFKSSIIININDIDTRLKEIQIKHITGKLTQDQYLEEEKKYLEEEKKLLNS